MSQAETRNVNVMTNVLREADAAHVCTLYRIKSQQSGQSWPLMRRAIPFDTTVKRQLKYRLQQELIIAKQKCGCAKRQKSSPGRQAWNVQTAMSAKFERCIITEKCEKARRLGEVGARRKAVGNDNPMRAMSMTNGAPRADYQDAKAETVAEERD
ncbi:hypothetical protein WN51_02485 [Melipona quadrifasciata]|uniref:Uncharacterized protein n=1 Tax=Melipona quadrifasciata TaxID=166423 RepID=A0A0M8ZZC9_9HYME|nr:hypothetical protein WN51_02485 [Melipona quadrifasciata]